MLELLVSLAFQEPVAIELAPGLQAECVLTGQINGDAIDNMEAVCPEQAPHYDELQGAADLMIQSLDHPVSIQTAFLVDPYWVFVWNGSNWVSDDIPQIARPSANYPRAEAERGNQAVCAGTVMVNSNGQAEPGEWECRAFRRNMRPFTRNAPFLDAVLRVIPEWEYLYIEGVTPDCTETLIEFQIASRNHSQDEEEAENEPFASNFPVNERPRCG